MVNIEVKAATYARNVYNGVPGYTLEKAKHFFKSCGEVFMWGYDYYAKQKRLIKEAGNQLGTGKYFIQEKELIRKLILDFNNGQLEAAGRIKKEWFEFNYGIQAEKDKQIRIDYKYKINIMPSDINVLAEGIKKLNRLNESMTDLIEKDINNAIQINAFGKWGEMPQIANNIRDEMNSWLNENINILEEIVKG